MPVYEQTHTYAQTGEDQMPVRAIATSDVLAALSEGAADFWRHPSHYLFFVIIYPVVGVMLAIWSAGGAMFPLLYPLATGFALLGPIVAIGLYELSRRREQGLDDSPRYAFGVLRHRSIGAIALIGLMLAVVFALWIASAGVLYDFYFGANPPQTLTALLTEVFTTPRGWGLLMWGNLIGLCFALFVLAATAIAFPLLVDKGGSASRAMGVSLRAFGANPLQMTIWGAIVAAVLFAASLPLFVGLAIALPILGHATWHLYRKIVP